MRVARSTTNPSALFDRGARSPAPEPLLALGTLEAAMGCAESVVDAVLCTRFVSVNRVELGELCTSVTVNGGELGELCTTSVTVNGDELGGLCTIFVKVKVLFGAGMLNV